MKPRLGSRLGYLIVVPTIFLLLSFQNCSETVMFSKDLSSSSLSAMEALSGKTTFYTNTNFVKVKVSINSPVLTQCRASIHQNMDEKNVPWQACSQNQELTVYLNEEFAAGGLKDGPKQIYVEASDESASTNPAAPRMKTQLTAFLDTLVPEIEGQDFLKKGLAGLTFTKDQSVSIQWTASDKVAVTGESSGIEPQQGIRWAFSANGTCEDSSVQNLSAWTAGDTRQTNILWPVADPLETFYICIYAQDRAGNRGYFLSQPLTSLWTVLAGDNSIGNGASITAPQVRFKSPYSMSLDPQNNLYFHDRHLAAYRMIKNAKVDSSRLIQSSPLPEHSSRVVFDSKGYGYYAFNNFLYQLALDRKTIKKIANTPGSVFLTIRKYKNIERLVVATKSAGGFGALFEIPLSSIASIPAEGLSFESLKAQYKLAGVDIVPATSVAIANRLTKNDSEETKALSFISAVESDDDGNIYLSSHTDGAGRGLGHQATRILKQNEDGSFEQTVLSNANWVLDLSFAKKYIDNKKHEYLILPTAYGLHSLDLTKWKETSSITGIQKSIISKGYFSTVATEYIPGIKNFEFYVGETSESKIVHLDGNFNILEVLGRDIYEKSKEGAEQDALTMVLGHPGGLFTAPNTSDIFIHDNQNNVIFRLNENGQTKKVAGKQAFSSRYLLGYASRITGDFSNGKRILYFGNWISDLNAGTETELYPGNLTNGYNWYNSSPVFVGGVDGKNMLFNARHRNIVSTESWHTSFTGFMHLVNLTGNTQVDTHANYLGDVMQGAATASAYTRIMDNSAINLGNHINRKAVVDSQKNMFISGGKFIINKIGESQSFVLNKPAVKGAFSIVEENQLRYVFYPDGQRISFFTIDMTKLNDSSENNFVSNVKALCLSGTTLKGTWDLAISHNGNLVIADSDNSRVLLYRLRDKTGALSLKLHGSEDCP